MVLQPAQRGFQTTDDNGGAGLGEHEIGGMTEIFDEVLVAAHKVAGFFVPGGDSGVGDRFRQNRHFDFNAHLRRSLFACMLLIRGPLLGKSGLNEFILLLQVKGRIAACWRR